MKKIISILIVLLTLINASVFCFATDEIISVNVDFSAGDNSIDVSGTVNSAKDRIPMTLYITSGDEVVGTGEAIAICTDGDTPSFKFDTVKLNPALASGTLSVKVSASRINETKTKSISYYGADNQFAALTALSSAIAQANASQSLDGLISSLVSNADTLGGNGSEINGMNDTAKYAFARTFLSRTYTLPENADTDENCKLVKKAVKDFSEHYIEANALAAFFEATTSSELQSWYDSYKTAFGLLLDDEETTEDETKMLSYFNDAIKSNGYLDRRTNIADVKSMKELNVAMKHQAMLEMVETSNQYVVRNIISDFASLLTADINAFNSISALAQGEVCLEVSGKDYASFAAFSSAINTAVSGYIGLAGAVSPAGPSGSSDRGGKGNNVYVPVTDESDVKKLNANFEDIAHVKWAHTAIRYLYKEGIVSGRNATTFAPDESITRAEFVKMIVLGFGLETNNAENKFRDISNSAWYKDYVLTASSYGVVNGDEKGNFNPNKAISREDAATLLYRLMNPKGDFEKSDFKDYNKVSDYAKKAVDYMQSEGIINGIGDGIFAPKNNITRAQAAKMLYLLLA